jgi:hypothetical protein
MANEKKNNDKNKVEFARPAPDERFADAQSMSVHHQLRPKTDRMALGGDSLFTEEELKKLQEQAAVEVHLDEKEKLRKQKLEQFKKEARAKFQPEEEIREVLMDLPGHAFLVRLNETEFHHNHKYYVPLSVYRVLNEIMYRAWVHEDEIGGANRDTYRRPHKNLTTADAIPGGMSTQMRV